MILALLAIARCEFVPVLALRELQRLIVMLHALFGACKADDTGISKGAKYFGLSVMVNEGIRIVCDDVT